MKIYNVWVRMMVTVEAESEYHAKDVAVLGHPDWEATSARRARVAPPEEELCH